MLRDNKRIAFCVLTGVRLLFCLSVCLLVTLTRSSATAKSTARPSCLVGVPYDISRERIFWWLINHYYVIGHKSYRIRRNNAKYTAITPFKIIQGHRFWLRSTNWKPICDFLLVNTTNLHPISHRFQVIADYWSNFRLRRRWGWSRANIRINFTSPEMTVLLDAEDRTIVCSFVWTKHWNVTDGRTDRQPVAITAVCTASNADAL